MTMKRQRSIAARLVPALMVAAAMTISAATLVDPPAHAALSRTLGLTTMKWRG
jgi:hypothetical protein